MNFKKLFSWLHILSTIAPIILTIIPGIPNALIPTIIKAIQEAEKQFGDGHGEEKKEHVIAATSEAITEININTDESINVSKTLDQVSKGINTVIKATNMVHLGH